MSRRTTLTILVAVVLPMVIGGALVRGGFRGPRYIAVDLKYLGWFVLDPRLGVTSDVPLIFRELDGQRVSLAGEVIGGDPSSLPTDFQLLYSNVHGHSPPPPVQERMFATIPAGSRVKLPADGYWNVSGILRVKLKRAVTGDIVEVFHLDVERIDPVDSPPPISRTITGTEFAPWQRALLAAAGLTVAAWAVFAIAVAREARRNRDRGAIPCPCCGYDLRATPDRCPECGALVAPVRRPPALNSEP
jgi:hypothetical protein